MAGTGLPIPKSGVLAQGPGVMDGDRLSSASAWASISRAGAQVADIGQSMMQTQRAGYMAELETEARRKRYELQTQFAADPAGFDSAWEGFTSGKLQQVDGAVLPHMQRIYAGEGTAAYGSLLNEKQSRDRGLAGQALTSRLTMASEDILGLAAEGRIGTPEFAAALQTYEGVGATLANSGFVSPDGFTADKQSLLAKAAGESVLYQAGNLYAEKGYEAALSETEAMLRDPASGLTPAEQRNYAAKVRSTLAVRETARREDLKEVRSLGDPIVKMLREGVDGIEGDGEQLAQRFEALGSPSDAARVRNALEFNRGFRGAVSLPTKEWGGAGFLDKMTVAESGGNATADNPLSSAFGAHQFIDSTWLATVQQHRPDLMAGKSQAEVLALRGDKALSREMAGYHAQDNAGVLRAAGMPVTDGTQYLAWFAGAGGATALWRADPQASAESVLGAAVVKANPFLRDMRAADVISWADKKMRGAAERSVDPALLAGRRAGAEKVFDEWAPKAKVSFARWGIGPQDVEFIRGVAPYLDEKRRADMRDLLTSGELATAMIDMPPQDRANLMGALETKAADGDPAARAFLTEAEGLRKDLETRERTDPLGRARDAGWMSGPTVIDWSQDSAGLAQSLAARNRDAAVTASRLGQPVIPALGEDEARTLASALTTGDPRRAMSVVMGMQSQLSPDQFGATMAMKPVQDALAMMARSGEVERMTAAFSAYDGLYRKNGAEFEARFGKATLDRLQDWQGKLQFYSPAEIAAEVKRADDPSFQAARTKLLAEGQKLVKDMTPRDIAGKFGTFFSTPGLVPDAMQNGAMLAEYQRLYADRFAATGDADTAEKQAMERMGNAWGVSSVNGGRLMRRPMEKHYPAIEGSHDWMLQDVEDTIRANGLLVPGPPQGPGARPRGEGRMPDYVLLSDQKTDADIAAGRPPSYVLMVTDANGAWKVPEQNGRETRMRWDPETAVESDRTRRRAAEDSRMEADRLRALPPGGLEDALNAQRPQ